MGEQDIKLFVRTAPGHAVTPIEIFSWCEGQLAYYQVPRYVEFVSDFLRGPTQRIRKRELPTSVENSWDSEKPGAQSRR